MGATSTPSLPPFERRPLLLLAAVGLLLQLLSSGFFDYGYMTDELYYLDSVDRLAWGYVDYPPLSIVVLSLVTAALGESLLAIRLLPALCLATCVFLTGALARELSGGRAAQLLAGLATLLCPVILGLTGFYSMNAIDLVAWSLPSWLLLRIANGGSPRLWLVLGAVFGAGLLNKFTVLWLGLGMGLGLVLTPQRRWLATPWPWAGASIALAMLAPHVWWQLEHAWPFLEFQRNAAAWKVTPNSPLHFLAIQLVMAGPVTAPIWAGGLVYLMRGGDAGPHRLLGMCFLVPLLLLSFASGARSYYLAPALPLAFAGGGVWVERLARRSGWGWLPGAFAAPLLVSAPLVLPLSLPLLSPERTLALQRAIGLFESPVREQGGTPELSMHLALRLHAPAILDAAARAWDTLSQDERERAGILTNDFGSAGAISILGRDLGLPRAIGVHNNYWLWGPGEYDGDVMVWFVDSAAEPQLRELYEQVERVAEVECRHCMPFLLKKSFFVCRGIRRPLREVWPLMKLYV